MAGSAALDLVIRGGTVVDRSGTYAADVGVVGERIACVGRGLRGRRELDAHGAYVLPGAIDGHVHIRTERRESVYDDTFATGSVAAAFGGVTTFIDQIQLEPGLGLTLRGGLERRLLEAEGQCVVDYSFHLNPREPRRDLLEEIPALAAAGYPSIKLFMAYEGYRLHDDALLVAMQQVARAGGLAIVHAENMDVIAELERQAAAEGRTGRHHLLEARPALMEGEATHRALAIARLAGCRVLVYHVTARDGVEELERARRAGATAYGEACLHYLLLDASLVADPLVGSAFEISPPLREAHHRAALWDGLARGALDVVSTDHGPRRLVDRGDGTRVPPPGTSGLEVRLPLMHEHGVRAGRLTLERWVDVCCTRPAEVFGLPTKGRVLPGYDADLVVFDPERTVTLAHAALHSNVDHATYEGMTVRGYPVATVCRGAVVVADGALEVEPGYGRPAPRGWR